MSFKNNFGKLRELGRKAVLPTNEIKSLLKDNIFDQYSINGVIDFGAGTLYWSNYFSEIVGEKKVFPVDIVFKTSKPNTNMKCFTSIDDINIKKESSGNLFFICDVIHHLSDEFWNDIKTKVFNKCDFVFIKDIDCHYKFKNFMNKTHDRIINGEKIHNVDPDVLINDLKNSGFKYVNMYNIHKLWYSHFVIIARKV